jgi:phage gp36-like protein
LARDSDQPDGTGASLSDIQIDDQISEADQEIDGRLTGSYKTPFDPVPVIITSISRDIAAYLCDLIFREVRDYQGEQNPVVLRYKRAQELLGRIVKGEIDLPAETLPSDQPSSEGQITTVINPVCSGVTEQDFDIQVYRPANRVTNGPDWWGIW